MCTETINTVSVEPMVSVTWSLNHMMTETPVTTTLSGDGHRHLYRANFPAALARMWQIRQFPAFTAKPQAFASGKSHSSVTISCRHRNVVITTVVMATSQDGLI